MEQNRYSNMAASNLTKFIVNDNALLQEVMVDRPPKRV